MPPPVQQRYNAKARGSVAGGSTHKNRKGKGKASNQDGSTAGRTDFDSNAEILPEREERERKETMRRALQPDEGAISSKKRKRLDAYINKKLKQESRQESLRLLAAHALPAHLPGSLKSTSTLGQNPNKPLSAFEMAARSEDLNVRRALAKQSRAGGGALWAGEDDEAEEVQEERAARGKKNRNDRNGRIEEVLSGFPGDGMPREESPPGSGLISTAPAKVRNNGIPKKAAWSNLISTQTANSSSSEFDSSDSANDSPSEDELQVPQAGPSRSSPSLVAGRTADADTDMDGLRDSTVQDVKRPPTVLPNGVAGSSLRRGPDGQVVAPRVVLRASKPRLTRMSASDRRLLRKRQRILAAAEAGSGDSEDDGENDEMDVDDSDDGMASEEDDESDEDRQETDSEEDDDLDSDSQEEEEEEGENTEQFPPLKKRKGLGFKDWALKQMGSVPAPDLIAERVNEQVEASKALKYTPVKTKVASHSGPLGASFSIPATSLLKRDIDEITMGDNSTKAKFRPKITRRPSIEENRQSLPIVAEEQPIVEAILLHPVVIICGDTGCGKTSQLPQMLYEAGFGFPGSENPGMIAVTQPRRVAAVSLAIRVASEMNLPMKSSIVAHQIRYSKTTSPETAIKFMTDGVLLRELAGDFLLKRYSVVVVDEAHERGVNTDVLVGVLSRVAKLREKLWREGKDEVKPLRIVIMSATLRVADFAENKTLFSTAPPIINIAARQHPVTVHFNRKTPADYVTEAFKKTVKIHARLPPGGILVFMTGQGEIQALCRKLEKKFGKKAIEDRKRTREQKGLPARERVAQAKRWEKGEEMKFDDSKADIRDSALEMEDMDTGDYDDDLAADVDDGDAELDPEALDSETEDEDAMDERLGIDKDESEMPLYILPLYSLLSNEQQLKVFNPPPEGTRLVIVATNVAETSLTIPGIKYVVDSGRAKERQYDINSGVQTFQVSWISKASASQRAGRAGRTGPGHCYRLYSSALFENHFEQFSKPEILRMPIEGIVLQMKSMNIDAVINFPFPTPPDRISLKKAEMVLTHLGALEGVTVTKMIGGKEEKGRLGGTITDLGKAMAMFPVTPRYGKMLVIGQQHECLPFIIAIVAGLSVGDPFLREEAVGLAPGETDAGVEEQRGEAAPEVQHIRDGDLRAKEERKSTRKAFFESQAMFSALGEGSSDVFKILSVIGASEHEKNLDAFCARSFVRAKALREIHQLKQQISSIASSLFPAAGLKTAAKLKKPTDKQLKVIRQVLCAAFIDQIAVRKDIATKVGGGSVYASTKGIPYKIVGVSSALDSHSGILGAGEDVFVHPGSILASREPVEWVVYGDIVRSAAGSGKVWIKSLTKINPSWISSLGKSLCTFSRPLELPSQAVQNKVSLAKGKSTVNSQNEEEREVFVTPHFGDMGLELPAMKVRQRKVAGRWILV